MIGGYVLPVGDVTVVVETWLPTHFLRDKNSDRNLSQSILLNWDHGKYHMYKCYKIIDFDEWINAAMVERYINIGSAI